MEKDRHDASLRARASLHLASERTFLAQMRTGIAVMAFGFVVARFALFLSGAAHHGRPTPDAWTGAAITVLGAAVLLTGALRYRRRSRAIDRGGSIPTAPTQGMWLAVLLTVVGLGLALYLTLSP